MPLVLMTVLVIAHIYASYFHRNLLGKLQRLAKHPEARHGQRDALKIALIEDSSTLCSHTYPKPTLQVFISWVLGPSELSGNPTAANLSYPKLESDNYVQEVQNSAGCRCGLSYEL